ncbi:MAG: epoxyqueuosine reductase QueH [Candidatus Omnitrophota bacterium]
MRILLHICCGPCAIHCVNTLREKSHTVQGFFYNPNIHPLSEYDTRKESVTIAAQKLILPVHFHRDHKFEDFFRKITFHEDDDRCFLCWQTRLKHTAEFAKKENYEAFTTTLLISPYQDKDKIRELAQSLAQKYEIPFFYEDFSIGFRESHEASREMGLYHQKYCGCIYSERERNAQIKN